MRVFISWSGERSRKVALLLREWLPSVLQAVVPFMSDEDIPKGAQWLTALNEQLANTRFGIVCVTPENREAAWLNFEAGAIANAVGESRVCPLLLGLSNTDVRPPMSIFQTASASESDLWKLLKSVNSQLEHKLGEEQLRKTYDLWLPNLLKDIETAMTTEAETSPDGRDDGDLIRETLSEVREQSRILTQIAARVLPTSGSPSIDSFRSLYAPSASPNFTVGDRIHHPKWGEGVISEIIGSAQDALATVAFDNAVGKKMLMLKYAPITKMSASDSHEFEKELDEDFSEEDGSEEADEDPDMDDMGDDE